MKPKNRLQLHTMSECLQGRRLLWFCHLEKMENTFWRSKYQTFEFATRGEPRKTWIEVIRRDLAE